MKVVDKRITKEHKHFAEIKIGDTFTKESSVCVFIKTQNVYEIDEWGYHELIVNAVCLDTGEVLKFSTADVIIPLNCECVIKED